MEKFNNLKSIPSYLSLQNIDTDMIIPKQFLKTIKRTGLGKSLFYEMRYDEIGNKISDFILNKEPYNKSKILLAGKNFGCGSSREHAPWALSDFGIKSVISSSFADIFYNNCFKNGILPIKIDEKIVVELAEYCKRKEEIEITLEKQEIKYGNKVEILMEEANKKHQLTINLEDQKIILENDNTIGFEIDPFRKKCLLEGLDDIGLTLQKKEKIDQYEASLRSSHPWII